MTRQQAIDSVKEIFGTVETKYPRYRGWLHAVNGSVRVAGKPGYVYVQRRDTSGGTQVEEVRMPDSNVPDVDGYPVILGRDSISTEADIVLRRDVDSYLDDLFDYILGAHASQHELPDGYDPVYVQGKAIVPLKVAPSLTAGTTIRVMSGWAPSLTGANQYYVGSGDIELASYIPTSGQLLVVVGYDVDLNTYTITEGDNVGVDVGLTIADIPTSPNTSVPLAAVHLYQDQTEIRETHIWEMRAFVAGATVALRRFVSLTDTPSDYTGEAGLIPVVNLDEDGIEFPTSQDLTYDGDELQVTGIRGNAVASQPPSSGHVLKYSGTQWEPRALQPDEDISRITPATTFRWFMSGTPSITSGEDGVWFSMQGFRIDSVYAHMADTGTSGSTIVDVEFSVDDGATWSSIYAVAGNRPEIAAGGSQVAVGALSLAKEVESLTLLRVNVVQVATGATDLTVQIYGQSGTAFGDSLTILGVA